MITKITIGIFALVSMVYGIADEIAVSQMLRAANGATMSAAKDRSTVDLSAARREATAAVTNLQSGRGALPKAGEPLQAASF